MDIRAQRAFLLIFISFLLIAGCQGKPSKYGTAADYMTNTIKDGISSNNSIANGKSYIPSSVKSSLLPNITSKNTNGVKSDLPKTKFNINAEGVPAKAFFLGLVEGTNINVLVHPDVDGSISITLKEVTISEVLAMVERVYGYTFEVAGTSVKVFPATLQSRTYKVNYLDMKRDGKSQTKVASSGLDSADSSSDDSTDDSSDDSDDDSDSSSSDSSSTQNSKISTTTKADFWTELRQALLDIIGNDDGRKVSVSPLSGQVIVVGMPAELREVEKFLRDSELTLNRQVILEAKILEVELNDGYRQGINWGMISRRLQASQLGNSSLHSTDLSSALPIDRGTPPTGSSSQFDIKPGFPNQIPFPTTAQLGSSFGGILSLGFNYKKFAAFVDVLSSQGNVQVLSSPRISTTNNQKAVIKVGEDSFFITDVSTTTTTTGAGATTSPSVTFDSFFSGIALDVLPNIDESGEVTLHIHPTISTVSQETKQIPNLNLGTAQDVGLAKIRIRESDSIVRAKNGELVVIGGLMQEKTEEVVTGVPGLMNIPFLGSIFRHTRQLSKKSELVILLRPVVVGKNVWNEQLEREYNRFESLDRGFHFGGNVNVFGTEAETF